MRIGETTYVEHQIGVHRDAVLEAERFEHQGEARAVQLEEVLDPVAQGVGGEIAGVHQVGIPGYPRQHLAFLADAFFQRAFPGIQGMAPPRFRESLDQGFVLGGEEDDPQIDLAAQALQLVRQPDQAATAA